MLRIVETRAGDVLLPSRPPLRVVQRGPAARSGRGSWPSSPSSRSSSSAWPARASSSRGFRSRVGSIP